MTQLWELQKQLDRHRQRGSARAARAMTRPRPLSSRPRSLGAVDYTVPGIVPVVAQAPNTCWATVASILMGWRDQVTYDVVTAMDAVGPEWGGMVRSHRGLAASDKARFLASAGLVAEPPMSYTVDAWEAMLRRFGPLWVTAEERRDGHFSVHARVLTAVRGDGTAQGTTMTFVNPAGGRVETETLAQFLPKFEAEAGEPGRPLRIQVVHWDERTAASAGTAHGQTFGAPSTYRPLPALVRQAGGGAGVALAGLGYEVLSGILQNQGDIKWTVQRMEGAKHPFDQVDRWNRGPWQSRTLRVSAARTWPALIGPLSADFDVTYRTNGHSVGYIDIQNVGTSDVALWGIDITATIMPDPDAYTVGQDTPVAKVDVVFNYHFSRVIGDDRIWLGRYSLYGNGQVGKQTRWTQQ